MGQLSDRGFTILATNAGLHDFASVCTHLHFHDIFLHSTVNNEVNGFFAKAVSTNKQKTYDDTSLSRRDSLKTPFFIAGFQACVFRKYLLCIDLRKFRFGRCVPCQGTTRRRKSRKNVQGRAGKGTPSREQKSYQRTGLAVNVL